MLHAFWRHYNQQTERYLDGRVNLERPQHKPHDIDETIKGSFFCLGLRRFNHELVFGVSVKNLSKAERLIYGDSLMTHAMILTAVTDKVCIHKCDNFSYAHTVFFLIYKW